jgi:hypothetical protein
MAINQPVAGQSEFKLITIDSQGTVRVIGSERVDKRFSYLNEEASNFVDLTPEQIELTEQVLAIWAAIAGYESGDPDAVKTELEDIKDSIVVKEVEVVSKDI